MSSCRLMSWVVVSLFSRSVRVCLVSRRPLVPLQGLSEDVSVNKFFDEPMLLKLAEGEQDDGLASLMVNRGGW